METWLTHNVRRNATTEDLLREFYGEDAGYVLQGAGYSLRRILRQPRTGYEAARCKLLSAHEIIRRAWLEDGIEMKDPLVVEAYLRLHLAAGTQERFVALWLNAHNRLLTVEDLFCGTVSQSVVYPRVVVYHALTHNAARVIFAHNPSGVTEPLAVYPQLINDLKQTLQLVDVQVLDHYVIEEQTIYSFTERGLL